MRVRPLSVTIYAAIHSIIVIASSLYCAAEHAAGECDLSSAYQWFAQPAITIIDLFKVGGIGGVLLVIFFSSALWGIALLTVYNYIAKQFTVIGDKKNFRP